MERERAANRYEQSKRDKDKFSNIKIELITINDKKAQRVYTLIPTSLPLFETA